MHSVSFTYITPESYKLKSELISPSLTDWFNVNITVICAFEKQMKKKKANVAFVVSLSTWKISAYLSEVVCFFWFLTPSAVEYTDFSYSLKKFKAFLPYSGLFTLEKNSAELSGFSFQA